MGKAFLKAGIVDFNRLYYRAVSRFKLKEDSLALLVQRRIPFVLNYIRINEATFHNESVLINELAKQREKSTEQEMVRKRIMSLVYLRIIERESRHLLREVVGADLEWLVEPTQ